MSVENYQSEVAVWDIEDALGRLRGRADRLLMIADIFPEESEAYVEQIERAHPVNDFEQLGQAAHTLKGVAANISALRLSELAEKLERGSAEQRTDMGPLVAQLRPEFQRLLAAMEQGRPQLEQS